MIQGRWKDQRTARQYLDDARATPDFSHFHGLTFPLSAPFLAICYFATQMTRVWAELVVVLLFVTLVWLGRRLWCSFYFFVTTEIKFPPLAGVLWCKVDFRFSFPNLM